MDRTAWILNLREPFGAALGRELVSRGWNVIGGDPAPSEAGAERQPGTDNGNGTPGESAEQRAADDGWGGTIAPASEAPALPGSAVEVSSEASIEASTEASKEASTEASSEPPRSGWTHGSHIGENRDIPTGTGTSGLDDFEGSVAFGPETNARPKLGASDPAYAEEDERPAHGADPNASNAAGAFVAAETEPSAEQAPEAAHRLQYAERPPGGAERGAEAAPPAAAGSAAEPSAAVADTAQRLPEHGRLHVVPLDARQPGALGEAARLTAELSGRLDLLVLNAGEIAPGAAASPQPGLPQGGPDDAVAGASLPAAADSGAEETTDGRLGDYETYALTPLRAVERLLPLMEGADGLKRICFVSSREGSISAGEHAGPIGRAMAHTALHMQARLLFNDLRRDGYTFRLYDPGLMPKPAGDSHAGEASAASNAPMTSLPASIAEAARFAAGFFANPHANEDRIVLTGSRGEEWPF
ncbi:hypothetical protein [Saccharibacillus brassicae]|uniref:SDR family NAD(P)-dependent oxidoreductase n=1 Tax=Saccharibacillus brassicae TaxID=2583377 RepID=A0A4Y6UTR5_SACBS|nr:hypothetical protein [Saccharibacillus brassicae]QDH20474.1 hypothetical protein FFV09_06130 [Saccharibacillus brassicae]